MPVLWAYARDLFQTPGFGDTIDFVQIKQHYYIVHADINPTRIVPKGPDLSNWLTPHGREALGGRPFGDGTAPGPTPEGERVPPGHSARPRTTPFGSTTRRAEPRAIRRRDREPGSAAAPRGRSAGRARGRRSGWSTASRVSGPEHRHRGIASDPRRRAAAARVLGDRGGDRQLHRIARVDLTARPASPGVSQSLRLSTSQYRYGPTRVRCPCEYALISGCWGSAIAGQLPEQRGGAARREHAPRPRARSTTRFTPASPPAESVDDPPCSASTGRLPPKPGINESPR